MNPGLPDYTPLAGKQVKVTLHPWASGPEEGVLLGCGQWGFSLRIEGGGRWTYDYREVARVEPLPVTAGEMPPADFRHSAPETVTSGDEYRVQTIGSLHQIPTDMAMDLGLIPDTRLPAPPVPWRRRTRWAAQAAVARARLVLGAWIAGVDPEVWE